MAQAYANRSQAYYEKKDMIRFLADAKKAKELIETGLDTSGGYL